MNTELAIFLIGVGSGIVLSFGACVAWVMLMFRPPVDRHEMDRDL